MKSRSFGQRQNYIKVLFSDGKIGWVNKDDLQKIKALYFWIFVLSVALVIFVFALQNLKTHFGKLNWAIQRYTISYKQEIIGTFNPQAQMILMNHQSALDIIALEELYPKIYAGLPKRIRRNSYFQSCYENQNFFV